MTLSLGWIGWLVIGGIAGWIASMIKGSNAQMGIIANIIVGVIGGVLGGLLLSLIGFNVESWGWILSFGAALLGSVILLTIINMIRR